MNKINTRQACLLVMLSVCSLKFLVLPSLLAKDVHNNLWLICLSIFTVELIIMLLFLKLMNKYPNMNIYELSKKAFGKYFSLFLCFIFAVYFFIKTIVAIMELKTFFVDNLYETFNLYTFLLPLILVIIYISRKGLRPFSRTVEIFFILFVINIIVIILSPIGFIEINALLPLFNITSNSLIQNIIKYNYWFGDFMIMFVLIGNIDIKKDTAKKMFLSYFASSTVVIVVMIVFYSAFSYSGEMHRLAITDLLEYSPSLITKSNVSWVSVVIWSIALILQSSFGVILANKCLQKVIPHKKGKISLLVIICGIVYCLLMLKFDIFKTIKITEQLSYFSLVVHLISPVFILGILGILGGKRSYERIAQKNI